MIFEGVFLALAGLSIALTFWQCFEALRFRFHERIGSQADPPPLSVLKPLRGCDSETRACLESWFRQEYPGAFELLFGVASADDPVCGIVEQLRRKYPDRNAQLVISSPVLGPNGKASTLCYLTAKARHEHLVISDADVYVPTDFLSRLSGLLLDPSVGLVNCFYILAHPRTTAMKLEAVAVNADFWTQVLQGIRLSRMNFALGAVVGTRRSDVRAIGGFEGLLHLLADDYKLGKRISDLGRRIVLCPEPVECRSHPQTAGAVWRHQLRWARTIRVCRPVGYFFSILGNSTLWALLAAATSPAGRYFLATALGTRMLGAIWSCRRLTGKWIWWAGPLAPVKDLAQLALWILAFTGSTVTWSGERFRVDPGGKLTRLA